MADKASLKDAKSRILLVRERFRKCADADQTNRDLFTEDMKFVHVPGEQWDQFSKTERGDDRPMYEFNRTRTTVKRIVNSMRNNPVSGKVRGVEDGDKETADILEGQIRNIINTSNFDAIRDGAAEFQVAGGYGAWRIVTKYSDDTAFEQDIELLPLRNPLCLYRDPDSFDQTGRDAKYWIYHDRMTKEAFEATYPNAEPVDFETTYDDDSAWLDEKSVRVAEHWWQQPATKTIYLLSNGMSIGEDDLVEARERGLEVIKERTVQCYEIYSAIYSGDAELTKPTKWAGKYHPWVTVYGEYIVIDGKVYWNGITRHVKDAQRSFNVAQTSVIETIARAPISQVWATAEQAKGLSKHWAEASRTNKFAQIYNADPKAPGPPVRVGGPDVPVASIQSAQIMGDEIKADSGIFDASLGSVSNESSGRAIIARQSQGELATFNFQANMTNSIRRTWEILIDLIPKVIDTPRALRILGSDDSEKYIRVNQPDANGNILNDLSRGKYDVVVTAGPSYATKQQEAVDAYTELGKSNPGLMAVAADLVVKGMDLPYSDEIAARIQATMPPQLQKILNKDGNQSPEVRQAMMLADQAMAEVQQHGQMVQAAAQEATQLANDAQSDKAAAEKAKSDVQIAVANLKVQEANLKVQEAQFKQLVAETQAKMAEGQQTQETANEREQLSGQVEQALGQIQQQAAEFMQQSAAVIAKMQQVTQPQVVVVDQPKNKTVVVERVNGQLIGRIIEDVPAPVAETIQ